MRPFRAIAPTARSVSILLAALDSLSKAHVLPVNSTPTVEPLAREGNHPTSRKCPADSSLTGQPDSRSKIGERSGTKRRENMPLCATFFGRHKCHKSLINITLPSETHGKQPVAQEPDCATAVGLPFGHPANGGNGDLPSCLTAIWRFRSTTTRSRQSGPMNPSEHAGNADPANHRSR